MKKNLLFLAVIFFVTPQLWAQYNPLHFYEEGRWEFSASLDYMHSTKNYEDGSSSFKALNSGNYMQTVNIDVLTRWTALENFGFYLGAGMAATESESVASVRTNSGIRDIKMGVDMLAYQGWLELIPEVYLIYPFHKVESDTDDVLLGDGAMVFGGKLWAQKLWKSFNIYGMIGAEYYNDERAHRLPYALGMELDTRIIDVGGEIGGFARLGEDENTDSVIVRKAVTDRVDGGSLKYYAVNPSLLEVKAWLNYDFTSDFSVKAGLGQTLNGDNTAYGMTFFAMMTFGFNPNEAPPATSASPRIKKKKLQESSAFDPVEENAVNQKNFSVEPSKTELEIQKDIQQAAQEVQSDNSQQEVEEQAMTIKLRKAKKVKKRNSQGGN